MDRILKVSGGINLGEEKALHATAISIQTFWKEAGLFSGFFLVWKVFENWGAREWIFPKQDSFQ